MKRFLVVGCGGSGGATLQFLMDQLRADLRQQGIHRLPKGWQFVHIDVPVSPDGVGPGMPPTVGVPGDGTYVALANPGAVYGDVALTVDERLVEAGRLGGAATWRPEPNDVRIAIANGAGQYRAVGRTVTLSRIGHVAEALERAWQALDAADVLPEMADVAGVLSPATAGQIDDLPLVLVVSSMAGGAGASMVLDVCRVLSQVHGVDPNAVALFLYTPEVFGELPANLRTGVDANAMAMTGELLSAQTGAAGESDARLLAAMGLPLPANLPVPFRRVIPIGAKVGGTGAAFGDGTARGVYRGLGRGLAALMVSGQATNQFVAYDMGNGNPPDMRQGVFGWAGDKDALVWGAFGFASLGLGRERYAEYAAQRVARQAVDRLVAGHLQAGDHRSPADQLAGVAGPRWGRFAVERLGLPGDAAALRPWWVALLSADPLPEVPAAVTEVVERWLPVPGGMRAPEYFQMVQTQVGEARALLQQRVDDAAYRWALDWYHQLEGRVEAAVLTEVAEQGLPVARAQLDRLANECDAWVTGLHMAARRAPADVAAAGSDVAARIRALPGVLPAGSPVAQELRTSHQQVLLHAVRARCAHYAAEVLSSLRTDLVEPLRAALGDSQVNLEDARASRTAAEGVAAVATDQYPAWPDGQGQVPRRFAEAHNEVLLTPAEDFESAFVAHLQQTEPGRAAADVLTGVVTMVVSGRWQVSGMPHTVPVLERMQSWRPAALPDEVLPRGTGATQPPRRAAYQVGVQPADVLDRARAWVDRRGEPFHVFITQSLRSYLTDAGAGEAEKARRAGELAARFRTALALARPLVAVNGTTVQQLHNVPLSYSYKFSDVPALGLPLADVLRNILRGAGELETTTLGRYDEALRDQSSLVTRIAIFGAYQNYAPVVFTSLLGPVVKRWSAALDDSSRKSFWQWRRARRLADALPFTPAQRRAVIGGWFVARATGRLRWPDEHPARTVEVWDDETKGWRAFPRPLLTAQPDDADWWQLLPAVLESSLVALAQCHAAANLAPLQPYALLRRLWDDTATGPASDDLHDLPDAARRHLEAYLRDGGVPSGFSTNAMADATSKPERQASLVTTFKDLRERTGVHFLAPGDRGAPGGGQYSEFRRPAELRRVPLFHGIAPEVHDTLGQLLELLDGPVPVDVFGTRKS